MYTSHHTARRLAAATSFRAKEAREKQELTLRKKLAAAIVAASGGDGEAAKVADILQRALRCL